MSRLDPLGVPSLAPSRNRGRYWTCIGFALFAHFLIVAPSVIHFSGCNKHDRPLGLPGGTGNKIAKGTPDGVLNATGKGKKGGSPSKALIRLRTQRPAALTPLQARKELRQRFMERFSRDGMLSILQSRDGGQVRVSSESDVSQTLDSVGTAGQGSAGPLGLPGGVGTGPTAPGSPFGSRIGAKLWLYRVKHGGDAWDANPRALPALLTEVHKALNVPVAGKQETITLAELPDHRGDFMPAMLFMTGTGSIAASDADRAGLRDYLLNGGMLVADSSGGSFEAHFKQFIASVLPGVELRPVEFDHEVFRGDAMAYKMNRGCPIYRQHGSAEALGMFAPDGRLMVFFSPGDLGSAWAVVELGKKRDAVEVAFHMGTNLVTYSLLTVRDQRQAVGASDQAK